MSSGMEFSGKVVIVTGASSGIGQAAAILFSRKGASVTLCGQNQERLDMAVKECRAAFGKKGSDHSIGIAGDLNDSTCRKSIVSKTVERFGKIDILVASAGVSIPKNDIYNCTEETFDTIFNTNVKAVFFLIQEALPYLEQSRGNIVSVSSLASTFVPGNRAAYPMSKAAVDHMTRCLALDLAPRGIRVNAVNPSFIPTRFRRHYGDGYQELVKKVTECESPKHPLHGECVTAEAVGDVIGFLASDAARFVTGQCHVIDAGRQYAGTFMTQGGK